MPLNTEPLTLRLLLVADQQELVDWFVDDVGALPNEDGVPEFKLSNGIYRLKMATEPLEEGECIEGEVDMMLGLMRFVDIISLQKMTQILGSLPEGWRVPTSFMIYRIEGETDFKMSCPYCGQKLWVRDADLDKRGRCPNCKKGFTLPAQDQHVKATLRLRDSVLVRNIEHGVPGSISGPLKSLVRLWQSGNNLKQASGPLLQESGETMKVRLDNGNGNGDS